MPMKDYLRRIFAFLQLPLSIQWRAYLVRLPTLVPLSFLKITSPEGPHPFIINLPSRGAHKIPVFVFLPPSPSVSDNLNEGISAPKLAEDDVCVGEQQRDDAGGDRRRSVPVHLDFRGGGFMMGSCLEQAPFCALLARRLGIVVLSVDYRKGPIDQFPAALHDAEDVLAAVLNDSGESEASSLLQMQIERHAQWSEDIRLDSTRLSVSGFSSGGTIALNLAMNVGAPEGPWPSLIPSRFSSADGAQLPNLPLLLFYPAFDTRLLPHERPRPAKMHPPSESTLSLSLSSLKLSSTLMPTYLPPWQATHPRASPVLADPPGLNSRAKILLVLPEIDTLAEQSDVWLRKMRDAGFSVLDEDSKASRPDRTSELEEGPTIDVLRCQGMRHGWTQFPESWLTAEALKEKKRVMESTVGFMKRMRSD